MFQLQYWFYITNSDNNDIAVQQIGGWVTRQVLIYFSGRHLFHNPRGAIIHWGVSTLLQPKIPIVVDNTII